MREMLVRGLLLFLLAASPQAAADVSTLVESESPLLLPPGRISVTQLGFYDGGYIPDVAFCIEARVGVLPWLEVGAGASTAYFPGQETLRVAAVRAAVRARLLSWGAGNAIADNTVTCINRKNDSIDTY